MIRQLFICLIFQLIIICLFRSLILPVILGYADLLVENYRRKYNK